LSERIVDLEVQPTAAVRVQQEMQELDFGALFGRYLPIIFGRVAELGETSPGPPYGRYYVFGPDHVDLEIGVPVSAPLRSLAPLAKCPPGEIGASELPAGPVGTTVHHGPYDGLGSAMMRLRAWILAAGRTPGAGQWESYVDDPAQVSDPADLTTELYWPLEH
jgi:effector-binding domain-containing protein